MPSDGFGSSNWRGVVVVGAIGVIIGLVIGYFFGSTSPRSLTTDESSTAGSATTASETQIQLVNHIQAELPEQDVFVELSEDSDEVVRPDVDETDQFSQSELFTAANPTEHDPFKVGENPLGPFPKGEALGFTLADWLAAAGSGNYTVDGSQAQLGLAMEQLVPNGVYTVWCSTLRLPPEPAVVDLPCGALDGSDNSFTADQNGEAEVSLTMSPLQPSTETVNSVIAVAYHSDGQTHGLEPGPFGSNSHVQLFFLMPPPSR